MSRDLTPQELFFYELRDLKEGRGSLWDFMENIRLEYAGESSPLHDAEEMTLRKNFPSLGRLFNGFPKLYEKLSQIRGGIDFLHRKDDELTAYIESRQFKLEEISDNGTYQIHSKPGKGDKDSYLIKWFEGTLDEGFYYNTYNDELLVEHILDEARSFSLDGRISAAEARTTNSQTETQTKVKEPEL